MIEKPYTYQELKQMIASHEYSAEMLLQHAMLLLGKGEQAATCNGMPAIEGPLSAAQAAQPLTDEQAEGLIEASDGRWVDGEFRIDGPDLTKLLRSAHGIGQPAGKGGAA